MSGHSHFKSIKRDKAISDQKRGQIFSKIARAISVTVKEGGQDPGMNAKLRLAIEVAKKYNMPKENIERAIKRGTGELENEKLAEIMFEAYGPGGITIIIEGITDNKNRALFEIKQILNQNGGKLVGEGSVRWMFERKINQESNALEWIPKQEIEVSEKNKEDCQKLFEALDELDSVQEVYSNLRF